MVSQADPSVRNKHSSLLTEVDNPKGYADYAAVCSLSRDPLRKLTVLQEALRSGIEFIGSLYADCLRWRHQKIEISIFSLILLGVGLLLATWVAFYSSATNVRVRLQSSMWLMHQLSLIPGIRPSLAI